RCAHPVKRSVLSFIAAAATAAVPICLPSLSSAASKTWIAGSGFWHTSADWSGGTLPATGDDVVILNQDATDRVVTYFLDSFNLRSFQLGNAGSGTNTFSWITGATGGQLICPQEIIGTSANAGVFSQQAGLNAMTLTTATNGLILGDNTFGTGTYNLSGIGSL